MNPKISKFSVLPAEALFSMQDLMVILGMGESTGWYRLKNDPDFPKPIRLSAKCTRFRVGDVREYIAKKAAQ